MKIKHQVAVTHRRKWAAQLVFASRHDAELSGNLPETDRMSSSLLIVVICHEQYI